MTWIGDDGNMTSGGKVVQVPITGNQAKRIAEAKDRDGYSGSDRDWIVAAIEAALVESEKAQ